MRYIVVCFLPKEIGSKIDQVREEFNPGASLIVPSHISVTFPFTLKNEADLDLIMEAVKKASQEINQFIGEIGEIREFGGKVIYLSVSPKEKFADLHSKLSKELNNDITIDFSIFPDSKIPEYTAHITLNLTGTKDQIIEATAKTKELVGQSLLIDKIFLLSNEKIGQMWKVERVFGLTRQ